MLLPPLVDVSRNLAPRFKRTVDWMSVLFLVFQVLRGGLAQVTWWAKRCCRQRTLIRGPGDLELPAVLLGAGCLRPEDAPWGRRGLIPAH